MTLLSIYIELRYSLQEAIAYEIDFRFPMKNIFQAMIKSLNIELTVLSAHHFTLERRGSEFLTLI